MVVAGATGELADDAGGALVAEPGLLGVVAVVPAAGDTADEDPEPDGVSAALREPAEQPASNTPPVAAAIATLASARLRPVCSRMGVPLLRLRLPVPYISGTDKSDSRSADGQPSIVVTRG